MINQNYRAKCYCFGRTHDNANYNPIFDPPYMYQPYRCDLQTFKKSIFVSPPPYLKTKTARWLVKDMATIYNGILIKKFKLPK